MTDFEKITIKTTIIKAGSVLAGFAGLCITIGVVMGDWSAWRKKTDERVNRIENRIFTTAKK